MKLESHFRFKSNSHLLLSFDILSRIVVGLRDVKYSIMQNKA